MFNSYVLSVVSRNNPFLGTTAIHLACSGHPHLRSEGHFQNASACPTNGTSLSVEPGSRIQPIAIGHGLSYHPL